MGYSSTAEAKLSDDDISEIIRLYHSGVSMRRIGKQFGVSHRSIGYRLKKNAIGPNGDIITINRINRGSKVLGTGRFDWGLFNSHREEEKAYWAGFITADGYICKNTLKIDISDKDIDHLKWWEQFNVTIKRRTKRKSCHIIMIHPHLIEWAHDWRIYSKKTGKEIFPKHKPDKLICHWLRGLIDGDGWFSYQRKHTIMGGICSASYNFLEEVSNFLNKYNIACKLRRFHPNGKNPYAKLFFYQRMAFRLYKLVYGYPCLLRKWSKVQYAQKNTKSMPDKTIELIHDLRKKGLSYRRIAKQVGYSYSAIKYRLLQNRGVS